MYACNNHTQKKPTNNQKGFMCVGDMYIHECMYYIGMYECMYECMYYVSFPPTLEASYYA